MVQLCTRAKNVVVTATQHMVMQQLLLSRPWCEFASGPKQQVLITVWIEAKLMPFNP